MDSTIVSTEIYAMFLQMIIICGTIFETKLHTHKSKSFLYLSICVFGCLAFDSLSYIIKDFDLGFNYVFILNMFNFLFPFFVYWQFLEYMYISISEKISVKKRLFVVGRILFGVGVVCTIYYSFTQKIFYISDGICYNGDYYEGYLNIFIVGMLYVLHMILSFFKKIGWHDAIAYTMFMVIPIIFLVLNLLFEQLSFTVASLALSCLVIYIMLQAERETHLIMKEEQTYKLAHYDELTKLKNRLAFNTATDSMEGEGIVGVAFCDVNGLKYTNDHYGHKAGDKLLCDFAELLVSCYGSDYVYRISGDEYAVVIPDISDEKFFEKKEKVLLLRNEGEFPIAAVGFVHGSKSEINRLLDMAEKEMYEDKKKFYAEYPKYGREKIKQPEAVVEMTR